MKLAYWILPNNKQSCNIGKLSLKSVICLFNYYLKKDHCKNFIQVDCNCFSFKIFSYEIRFSSLAKNLLYEILMQNVHCHQTLMNKHLLGAARTSKIYYTWRSLSNALVEKLCEQKSIVRMIIWKFTLLKTIVGQNERCWWDSLHRPTILGDLFPLLEAKGDSLVKKYWSWN